MLARPEEITNSEGRGIAFDKGSLKEFEEEGQM